MSQSVSKNNNLRPSKLNSDFLMLNDPINLENTSIDNEFNEMAIKC